MVRENVGEEPRFERGVRVEANWKGSQRLYPGTVGATNEDGSVEIRFDDGDYEPRQAPRFIWPLPANGQAATAATAATAAAGGRPVVRAFEEGQLVVTVGGDGVMVRGRAGRTWEDGSVEVFCEDGVVERKDVRLVEARSADADEPAEFDFGEERRQAAAAAAGAEWFPQGTRVNARWKGSRFYPGTVGRTHEDGTVQVFFDDGDYEEREPVADILRM